jgi:hypothetical protein
MAPRSRVIVRTIAWIGVDKLDVTTPGPLQSICGGLQLAAAQASLALRQFAGEWESSCQG